MLVYSHYLQQAKIPYLSSKGSIISEPTITGGWKVANISVDTLDNSIISLLQF